MRDIRLKDDRESRQRQMEFLQRDIQNLPAEAAAQLREAHYTLSMFFFSNKINTLGHI